MLRKCNKISLERFKIEFGIKNIYDISLFVDEKNKEEILNVLNRNSNRFRRIVYELLQGKYNNDLYGKEEVSHKAKNITAFKFKRNRDTNYRIYCKEYIDELSPNIKKVVMIRAYNKKTQKIDKKIKLILESIANYKYDI